MKFKLTYDYDGTPPIEVETDIGMSASDNQFISNFLDGFVGLLVNRDYGTTLDGMVEELYELDRNELRTLIHEATLIMNDESIHPIPKGTPNT